MSFVCGNADSARQLQNVLNLTMRSIEADVANLEKAAKEIKSGWRDSGAAEVDEMISAIKGALQDATDASAALGKSLDAYAAFLERK